MNDAKGRPYAVVFACEGGAQGDLSVVRTLGRAGVPIIVIAEYEHSPASRSRYCLRSHVIGSFSENRDRALERVLDVLDTCREPPVLFPTADPDLRMLSACRDALERHARLFLSERSLVEACLDKGRFAQYASQFGVPLPQTRIPGSREQAIEHASELHYPVILKPSRPDAWTSERIRNVVSSKKAIVARSPEELSDWYERIDPGPEDVVLQEYIQGRDDRLYSLHVYVSRSCEPLGWFTGQKIRTWPAYAGIGCFVRSVYVPEIVQSGLELLSDMKYTGMALLQFKLDERDGIYKLLEINPRVSSWNLLAYECGVNLPFVAYADSIGLPVPRPPRQLEGPRYVYFGHDRHAFRDYRTEGDWTWYSWARSLWGRNVYQLLASDDLGPFTADVGDKVLRRFGRTS